MLLWKNKKTVLKRAVFLDSLCQVEARRYLTHGLHGHRLYTLRYTSHRYCNRGIPKSQEKNVNKEQRLNHFGNLALLPPPKRGETGVGGVSLEVGERLRSISAHRVGACSPTSEERVDTEEVTKRLQSFFSSVRRRGIALLPHHTRKP